MMASGLGTSSQHITLMPSDNHQTKRMGNILQSSRQCGVGYLIKSLLSCSLCKEDVNDYCLEQNWTLTALSFMKHVSEQKNILKTQS